MYRIIGVVLAVLGVFLIFTPVILDLKWIPLISVLLNGITSLATLFFSLIVGMTICLLVIAVAWLCFRPLLALSLLTLASISISLIFFWDRIVEKIVMQKS